MKKAIWAVIVIGFLAVSCGGGGGNIKKVQNGVFPDVDSTITVGQAFANDATLKGGEWKAYTHEGREIVSYTVQFTPSQINAQRKANNDRPNYAVAKRIYELSNYNGFSLQGEELKKFRTVFEPAYKEVTRTPQMSDFFDKDEYSTYFDPWIMERLDSFMFDKEKEPISRNEIILRVKNFIDLYNVTKGDFNDAYTFYYLHLMNYHGVPEFETALKNSVTNYNEKERIAKEKFEAAKKAREKDIDPLITVNRGSIAFFFVMDQANKDAFNIGGMYLTEDLELDCFDNKQVTWEFENTDPNLVLRYIYKPDSRANYFL